MTELIDRVRVALGGRYRIERELGRGGMGVVYLGTDRELHRDVAIKVLPPELASAAVRERFVREARIAAGLSHPNLVSIFDVGAHEDLVWFVMAFVDGESVATKVEREGPQPLGIVRRVLSEVAQGLAYAHARGVVHRDIKPDNILLERDTGRALVTDFGIAKGAGPSGSEALLTAAGEIIGTARYMSPEQAMGEPVDGRSDMYALGLVAYLMITGDHAIRAMSLPAAIAEHVRGADVRFDQADRALPPALVSALQRCVAPAPSDRFGRMEELVEQLHQAGGALPESPPVVRTLMRDLARAAAAAVLLAVGVLLVGVARIDPLVWVLGVGVIGWMMLDALEHASRRGLTWSMIRRAVHAERARRREEGARDAVGPMASAFYAIVAALAGFFGIAVTHGADVQAGGARFGIFLSTGPAAMQWHFSKFAIVAFVVALSIVVARRRGIRLPFGNKPVRVALVLMLIGWGAAIAQVLVTRVSAGTTSTSAAEDQFGISLTLLIGLAGVMVLLIGGTAALTARLVDKLWTTVTGSRVPDDDWRIPRWIDVTGSWVFDRLLRKDGGLARDRDRSSSSPERAVVRQTVSERDV